MSTEKTNIAKNSQNSQHEPTINSLNSAVTDHKEKLLQKFRNLQNFKPTDSTGFKLAPNVKIFVGPTKRLFNAHLLVLLMWSETFAKHLMQVDKQTSTDRYEMLIEDVDSVSAFNDFMTYLYSGCVSINLQNSRDLLSLSIKFNLMELKAQVLQFIHISMDSTTVLSVLPSALALATSDEELLKKCWTIIENDTQKVLEREEFLSLSQEVVLEIVKRDRLNIEEILLLQKVIEWAHFNSKKFYSSAATANSNSNSKLLNTLNGSPSNSPNKSQLQSSPLQKQLQMQQLQTQQEKLSRKVAGGLDRDYFDAIVMPMIKEIRFPLMKPQDLMGIVKNMNILDKEYYIMCLEFNAAPQSFDANKKCFRQRKQKPQETATVAKEEETKIENETSISVFQVPKTIEKEEKVEKAEKVESIEPEQKKAEEQIESEPKPVPNETNGNEQAKIEPSLEVKNENKEEKRREVETQTEKTGNPSEAQ